MLTFLLRRSADLHAEPERGSIMSVLLVMLVFAMLGLAMVTSSLNLSLTSRASKIRTANSETLTSLRTQVVGGLNSGKIVVPAPAAPASITVPAPASGCDSSVPAFAAYGLNFNFCAGVSFSLVPTTDRNGHDDTTAYGNLRMTVTLESWQSNAAGAKMADLTNSFQAYGTCVTGYVPGTGTDTSNPAIYTPCTAATAPASRHILWVARDSQPPA